MTILFSGTELSTGRRKPSEIVAEYEAKRAALADAMEAFHSAGDDLKRAATVGGAFGNVSIDTGHVYSATLEKSLLCSAWRHFYQFYDFEPVASADDKRLLERTFADPPPFTVENLIEVFGKFQNPRAVILRGMAEVFCQLDPVYRSHEKMKIGVKGLPKRVILGSVGEYGSYGRDRLRDILNALAAYQGLPLVTHVEMAALLEDGEALRYGGEVVDPHEARQFARARARGSDVVQEPKKTMIPARGVWLKRFANGNGHLFFGPDALRAINMALAEYYGEVLPDCPNDDARPDKPRASTAVSKDLQYYPTPSAVVDRVLADLYGLDKKKVLEPSCGCGRFLDGLRARGARAVGIEVDRARADLCRSNGHSVIVGNFLEAPAGPDFDLVVMNPPFYGRHYAKHVRHALRFLKPGGQLVAILPASARYDHGELDDLSPQWRDLPVGSFSESGTNINTTVATIWAPKECANG